MHLQGAGNTFSIPIPFITTPENNIISERQTDGFALRSYIA
jgi:hypothetical protein